MNMLFVLVSCAVFVSLSSAVPQSCPDICHEIYRPVCGSDGVTYSNLCSLRSASCRSKSGNITKAHQGECRGCGEVSCATVRCGSGEDCAVIQPQCFTTPCCEQAVCRPASKAECPTICPLYYSPVCGSDGKTYGNTCQLGVATCLSSGAVTQAHQGGCGTTKTSNCATFCNKIHAPVCGSNGVTYNNKCLLEKAACDTATNITITSAGDCPDPECLTATCATVRCGFGQQCEVIQPQCVTTPCCRQAVCTDKKDDCKTRCNKIYRPVCGSDGVTYNNQCFLDLARCQTGTDITVVSNGQCPQPVCGVVSCSTVRCGSGEECAVIQPQCSHTPTPCCPRTVCRPASKTEFIWQ